MSLRTFVMTEVSTDLPPFTISFNGFGTFIASIIDYLKKGWIHMVNGCYESFVEIKHRAVKAPLMCLHDFSK